MCERDCAGVHVCGCVRVRVCACAGVRMCGCVRVRVGVKIKCERSLKRVKRYMFFDSACPAKNIYLLKLDVSLD